MNGRREIQISWSRGRVEDDATITNKLALSEKKKPCKGIISG
jgi:hypothetical protein